ncbi:MAG: hypothetical protein GC190_09985 [Alphaproteobacteria bacterium]|nr:hypothetical protein [Alphaproteobacteria bacterium]
MTSETIKLDAHRGMAAQKATVLRRELAEIQADQAALKARQEELEKLLVAAPSATWVEAGEKARYLISLLAATPAARDPRRKTLIANVLEDLRRLTEDGIDKRTPDA